MAGEIESNSGGVVVILCKEESSYDIRPLYLLARAPKRTTSDSDTSSVPTFSLCAACPDRRFWPLRRGQQRPTWTTQRTLKVLAHKVSRVLRFLPPFPTTLPPFLFPPFCTSPDMSDVEEKKSGYRLEYAKNNRAKCKGPKPCNGTVLEKGVLKLGSVVDFRGHTSMSWRHWGCTTPTIIINMKKSFSNADELDGFEDLQPADQEKVRHAWDDGHVADEDIPETARKPQGDDEADEAKPKKKRASTKKDDAGEEAKPKKARTSKKKADEEGDAADDAGEKEKPKKASTSKSRSKKAKDESKEVNGADEDEEEKPKKAAASSKKAPAAEKKATEKKTPAKKRAPKKDVEESGEDFADEIDDIPADEDELSEPETKKRKKPSFKTAAPKPASKKAKPASSRAKKAKPTDVGEED